MVTSGLQHFLEKSDAFKGRRIALIANQTSVTADCAYSWDALRAAGLRLVRIFSPEHGLFGTEQDQAPVTREPLLPVPVVSLYGASYETLIPDRSLLDDIDLILFDIQDVGTRYYTFVNTMILAMRSLGDWDGEFIVLDRPNPLAGLNVEGPLLREEFSSFVGVMPVPVRHGMTAGELARMARAQEGLAVNLSVLQCGGWRRHEWYDQTGLAWITPSPNMPGLNTALVYPGMCLLEGTNISEGRGSTTPFELAGAPFIDPAALAARLNSIGLPGVYFRPCHFKPTFNKYAGIGIGGVFQHVTDRGAYLPFLTGIAFVREVMATCPEAVFLRGVYEFNSSHPAFDLLAGSALLRGMIAEGASLRDMQHSWLEEERTFLETRAPYLLYQ